MTSSDDPASGAMLNNQMRMLEMLSNIERRLSETDHGRQDGLDAKYQAFRRAIDWYVASGSSDIQKSVLEIMQLFRPRAAAGHRKIRLGSENDGGYICLDDLTGIDTALSFGVDGNADWDLDVAARGIDVRQFDHTIERPPAEHPLIVWEKKEIAPEAGETRESINSLVERHDKGRERPNLILKMDIEGAEWSVLNATDPNALRRFNQIICEFHAFEYLAEKSHRIRVFDAMTRLADAFGVVHVHANNFGNFANVSGVVVPTVLEVTFANTSIYRLEDTTETFPGPLDAPCDPWWPDLRLGTFTF